MQSTSKTKALSGPASPGAGGSQDLQYTIQEAANAPVKKKKKKVVSSMAQGSHLEAGGLGGKPSGSAMVDHTRTQGPPLQAQSAIPITSQVPPKKKKKRPTAAQDGTQPVSAYSSDSESSEQSHSDRPRTYNTRAAGMLTKQPSVVREDREGEELEEKNTIPSKSTQNGHVQIGSAQNGTIQNGSAKVQSLSQADTLPGTSETATVNRHDPTSNSEPKDEPKIEQPTLQPLATANLQQESKRTSLSPARSARFSSHPIFETPGTVRHEPPARSLSPVKSALKQSPSPRGPSPADLSSTRYRPGQAPSEASDTLSVVSDEGSRSGTRRKKSVRVSFDDDPTIVGEAAQPFSAASSPIILSPQNKLHSGKLWFSLGRDKRKDVQTPDESDNDVIKPVPTLPSFGSVRERKGEQDTPTPRLETVHDQSSTSSSVQTLQETHGSNDHALGGIIAEEFASRSQAPSAQLLNEPLPPDVTSVEGSGYHSDTESSVDDASALEPRIVPEELTVGSNAIPVIAVQPATPGIEGPESNRESWLYMPGGFPSTESFSRTVDTSGPSENAVTPDATPSAAGIAEPEPEVAAGYHQPGTPVVGQIAESIVQQTSIRDMQDDDSDDTGDSIYSDAAEDVADFEGDGFGSINAIVDSPVVAPSTLNQSVPSVDEEMSSKNDREQMGSGGWEGPQAFWSAVNGSRKTSSNEPEPDLVSQKAGTRSLSKPADVKAMASEPATEAQSSSIPNESVAKAPTTKFKTKPKAKPMGDVQPMRKSMRESAPPRQEPARSTFRSSMRNEARQNLAPQSTEPHRLASSMRGKPVDDVKNTQRGSPLSQISESAGPKGTLQKRQRPASAGGALSMKSSTTNGTGHPSLPTTKVASKRLTAPPQAATTVSSLRRNTSNGSDSSSSFKKARKSTSTGGRYTMKRSMRSDAAQARPQSEVMPSNFSIRSTSPSAGMSRRPMSSSGLGMRTSLRGPNRSTSSALPASSSGFGRGAKVKAAKATKPPSRFASRFGDSSDEEDGPKKFSSRFADSSDEDEPSALKLTPIRGIPKRIDEGDSTDLEDSDDEANKEDKPKPLLKQPMNNEGSVLASGSLRQNGAENGSATAGNGAHIPTRGAEKEKRKSFFGSLGRRKDKSKVSKADIESAARRDTPLERTKLERSLLPATIPETPSETPNETPTQSPRSPKLQRRHTPQRMASDSWPLPETPTSVKSDVRPVTSDGTPRTRPPVGGRQLSTATTDSTGAVIGKTGKKKRFPMLRKAFGLHD